jgi:hypothetical protein
MDAGKPLLAREPGEIARMLFHPIAEPAPKTARVVVRQGLSVDHDAKGAHDQTNPNSFKRR